MPGFLASIVWWARASPTCATPTTLLWRVPRVCRGSRAVRLWS